MNPCNLGEFTRCDISSAVVRNVSWRGFVSLENGRVYVVLQLFYLRGKTVEFLVVAFNFFSEFFNILIALVVQHFLPNFNTTLNKSRFPQFLQILRDLFLNYICVMSHPSLLPLLEKSNVHFVYCMSILRLCLYFVLEIKNDHCSRQYIHFILARLQKFFYTQVSMIQKPEIKHILLDNKMNDVEIT